MTWWVELPRQYCANGKAVVVKYIPVPWLILLHVMLKDATVGIDGARRKVLIIQSHVSKTCWDFWGGSITWLKNLQDNIV